MGELLGQHRHDARLAVAGAVLFAASFLLMRLVGVNFELPAAPEPSASPASLTTQVLTAASMPTPSPVAGRAAQPFTP